MNELKTKEKVVHIAMSSDDNYFEYLVVAVCSVLVNLSNDYDLSVHILNEEISLENKKKLENLRKIRDFSFEFLKADLKPFEKLQYRGSKYISKISAGRFLLPELLPMQDKCIYLDCDLIVRKDISKLWNIDIQEHPFGAVEEPVCRARNIALNIPDQYSHFNSGVLLLNLKKLREVDFKNIVIEFLDKKHEVVIGDQDTTNAIFFKQWYALPAEWNMTVSMYYKKYQHVFYKYDNDIIKGSLQNPGICHFTEKEKPNSFLCKHPYCSEYLKCRKLAYLPDEQIIDKNVFSFFIKMFRPLRMFFYFMKYIIRQKCPYIFLFLRTLKRVVSGYYFKRK